MAEGKWLVWPEQNGQDEKHAWGGRGRCAESRTAWQRWAWQRRLCQATYDIAARKMYRVHSHCNEKSSEGFKRSELSHHGCFKNTLGQGQDSDRGTRWEPAVVQYRQHPPARLQNLFPRVHQLTSWQISGSDTFTLLPSEERVGDNIP